MKRGGGLRPIFMVCFISVLPTLSPSQGSGGAAPTARMVRKGTSIKQATHRKTKSFSRHEDQNAVHPLSSRGGTGGRRTPPPKRTVLRISTELFVLHLVPGEPPGPSGMKIGEGQRWLVFLSTVSSEERDQRSRKVRHLMHDLPPGENVYTARIFSSRMKIGQGRHIRNP
ncbi:hypothetical protein J2129_000063 [Methanofollis sp. W23]|nr:hypothetical protein [Methanofollis sp. W23]